MDFEYKVKISGDTSNLEKALKLADGQMQKLEKDEVLIKLAYDGNYDSFYKTLKQIYKEAPEIGVKFQYDLNLKALEQEKKKLDKMELFSNPEKLYGHFVDRFDEFRKSAKGLSNTEIINSDSLKDARIELSKILNVLGLISPDAYDLINKPIRNLIESFKEFDNIDPKFEIVNPKDLENQRKKVLEIEENINSLKGNLKEFNSDQVVKMVLDTSEFDEKFTDIKNKLDQLDSEKTIKINAEYSEGKSSGSDKLSDISKGWSEAVDLSGKHSKERYTVANSQTGYVANSYLEAEAESVEAKLISKLIDNVKQKYDQIVDTVVHSHPKEVAAFSDDDIALAFKQVEQGIINQIVISAKEVMSVDYDKVNTDMSSDIVNKIREEYKLVDYELYDKAKVLIDRDAKEIFSNIAKTALPNKGTGKKVYEDFISGFDEMYSSIDPLNLSLNDINYTVYDYFNKVLEKYFKSSIVSGATLQGYSENFGKGIEDYVNSLVGEDIQRRYQEVLKSIFSNSKYLRSGETSAISVSPIEDFKFANDKQSDKEVEVSVKPKVDINTFIGQIREELDSTDSEVGISIYPKNIGSFVDEIKEVVKDTIVEVDIKPTVLENIDNDETKLSSDVSDKNKIQEIQSRIKNMRDFLMSENDVVTKLLFGEDGNVKTDIQLLKELETELNSLHNKFVTDNPNGWNDEDYIKALSPAMNKFGMARAWGLLNYEDINKMTDRQNGYWSPSYFEQLFKRSSGYSITDNLSDDYFSIMRQAIDAQKELQNAMLETSSVANKNGLLSDTTTTPLSSVDDKLETEKTKVDEVVNSEVAKFEELKSYLENDVVNAIETKTAKFEEERDRVDNALQDEINKLDSLKEKITDISDKGTINVNVKETVVDENSNNSSSAPSKNKKKTTNTSNVEVSSEFIPPTSAIKQKGIVGDTSGWSWVEDIGGGQLKRTVVSLNRDTGKFETTVKDIDTDFKKVENDVLKLDKEIETLYQKGATYDDTRTSRLEEERNALLEVLDLYAQSEKYAYSDTDNSNFQNRRAYAFEGMALDADAKEQIKQAEAERKAAEKKKADDAKYEDWKQKQLQIGAEKQAEAERKAAEKAKKEQDRIQQKRNEQEQTAELKAYEAKYKAEREAKEKSQKEYNESIDFSNEQNREIKVNDAIERQVSLYENILEIRREISKLDTVSDSDRIDELKQEEKILERVYQDSKKIVDTLGTDSERNLRNKKINNLSSSKEYLIIDDDKITKAENEYATLIADMKSAGTYTSSLVSETEDWKTSLGKISTQADLDKLISKLQLVRSEFKKLKSEQKNIPKVVETKEMSQDAKDVINAYKTLASNEMRIAKIEQDGVTDLSSSQKTRLKYYQEQNKEAQSVLNNTTVFTEKEIEEINKASATYENAKKSRETYYKAAINASVEKLQDTSIFVEQISDLDKLDDGTQEYQLSIQRLNNALREYEELQRTLTHDSSEENLRKVKKAYDGLSKSIKEFGSIPVNETSRSNVILKTTQWMAQNSKITKQAKNELNAYIEELRVVGNKDGFDELVRKINTVKQEEIAAGNAARSFSDKLKLSYENMARYFASFGGFYKVIEVVRQAFSTVKELDTALIDLRKTTSMSNEELNNFYYTSNDIAKQMGVTTQEIIDQASAWSRLGYATKEEAETMAKLSSQFSSISPGMTTEKAQSGLVSIMKAWDVQVDEVKSVMDAVNILGNSFAETNEDIIDGMQRSAAALSATGTEYNEAFALFTGAQEVLQNAEVGGRALRSISMRIRGYSEDSEDGAEEISEDLANISGDLINLTKTAQHAQGVSIFKEGSDKEFKSLVDYFREINAIWDEMDDKQQNDFLQKAFGKTQAQAGAAIIKNFDAVEDALTKIEESSGSADKEMEVIQQSIGYKLNNLQQTWVGIFQNIIQRDDIGEIVDSFTNASVGIGKSIESITPALEIFAKTIEVVANSVGFLSEQFGILPALTVGGFALFKKFGRLKCRVSLLPKNIYVSYGYIGF